MWLIPFFTAKEKHMKTKKNNWDCTIENDQILLCSRTTKEKEFFTKLDVHEITKWVISNKVDNLVVKLDALEKPKWLNRSEFILLQYSQLPVNEYTSKTLSDIFEIKTAYAIACIFEIKHLEMNEVITDHVIYRTFISSINNDYSIPTINSDYDTVVNKEKYDPMERQYINAIINKMGVKKEYYNIDKIINLVRACFIEIPIESKEYGNRIYYTIKRNIDIAQKIKELLTDTSPVQLNICDIEDVNGDMSQYEAMKNICNGNSLVNILQSGPGCGKSQLISAIVHNNPGKVCCAAHFNAATKNLGARILRGYFIKEKKIVKGECFTHEICEPMTIFKTFNYAIKKAIDLTNIKLLIIDESSVVSYGEFEKVLAILDNCSPKCKLLLVGDINQCYPVGGKGLPLLEFLTNSENTNYLKISHRMSKNMQKVIDDCNNGVFSVTTNNEDIIVYDGTLKGTCEYALEKYKQLEHTDDFGVITPRTDDCNVINNYVDDYFLSKNKICKVEDDFGNKISPNYVGRRVIVEENYPELRVFKKDILTITNISKTSYSFESLEGTSLEIDVQVLPNFKPAWATTVHSYQGREVNNLLFHMSQALAKHEIDHRQKIFWASRNLFVVGLSRAKQTLTIVDDRALEYKNGRLCKTEYDDFKIREKAKGFKLLNYRTSVSPNGIFLCKAF